MSTNTTIRRVMFASVVGSAIEWFDYFLYGTLASLVFSKLFFPTGDPLVSLTLAYSAFALTFIVRPIGGVVFGHFGDRLGRKRVLVVTLVLMGGGTGLIGLLPTYHMIGLWAPGLLVLLRLVQGFGIGGEWAGALLLAYEYAPAGRKGFYGSLPQVGVVLGLLLSTLSISFVSMLSDSDFLRWGWRVPFLLSFGLVLTGLWIRIDIDETPEFVTMQAVTEAAPAPLLTTLHAHWCSVLIAVGAKFVETAPFYIFTVFSISYATNNLLYTRMQALGSVTIGALTALMTIPIYGYISDLFGRQKVFLFGAVCATVFSPLYFILLNDSGSLGLLMGTMIGLGLIWPMVTSVLGTLFSEMFPVEVRYTGVTIGYQTGAALAGGTAPLVATWLLAYNDGHWGGVSIYMAAMGVISFVAVAALNPPQQSDLETQV